MEWIGCVRCKKSRHNFVAQTFALIAPAHPVLHRVSCSYESIWNAPKYYATHQNMSLRSNVADWVRSLRKIPAWLRGTSFRINCTNSPCLHRVSCVYEMIPNAPKHYETHQNISLGSNGVDVCSLRNILMRLRGTKFCTSSDRFAPSFLRQPNRTKCTQMVQNSQKHEFRVQWGWIRCVRCEKFQCNFVAQTFALVRNVLPRVS